MPSPKVSVLIPTYNYAHFLDETIQSVLEQTFTDFELVIVDNQSTDNTPEVIEKYLHDNRVRFYRNETNLGLMGNWNRCLEYARGEYIKFLCADDKFHPQLLEKFVAVMDQNPNVSIVSSYNKWFGLRDKERIPPFQGLVNGRCATESLIRHRNWLFAPTANMFRGESLKKVGKFNPQLHFKLDLELYIRLLSIGDCYVIPEFLSYTRTHPDTQSSALSVKKYEHIYERYKYMTIVKSTNMTADSSFRSLIDEEVKKRAINCHASMYEVLPKLHKKKNRKIFKQSFYVGYSEGVLFKTIFHFFKWKNIKKISTKVFDKFFAGKTPRESNLSRI